MKNKNSGQESPQQNITDCEIKQDGLMAKCRRLLVKYESIIIYLIFGVLTTLVDYVIRFFLYGTALNFHVVNIIGWIAAVIFAFVTNRRFVFHSRVRRFFPIMTEFFTFTGSRVVSLGIQELLYEIGVTYLHIDKTVLMIPVSVLVVVLNYFLGRLIFLGRKLSKKSEKPYTYTEEYTAKEKGDRT